MTTRTRKKTPKISPLIRAAKIFVGDLDSNGGPVSKSKSKTKAKKRKPPTKKSIKDLATRLAKLSN